MSNRVSSLGMPSPPPLRRFGGVIPSTIELSLHAAGDIYMVEGTGTVQSLPARPKGDLVTLHFAGAPTFMHSSKLRLPGGRDIAFADGDTCQVFSLGNRAWRVISTNHADGSAAAGSSNDNFVVTPQQFGASGSAQTTTATIVAGTQLLTLTAAQDFRDGQTIRVNHAGAAFAVAAPTGLTAAPTGSGATTYTYTIAPLDRNGGVGAAIANVTCSNNATLDSSHYNTVSWSGSADAFGVYGRLSGSLALLGIVAGTSFVDAGQSFVAPDWVPSAPQGSALADWLVTSIVSGGGALQLTLASAAGTSATTQAVVHDDYAALQAAINAAQATGGLLRVPRGIYNCFAGALTGTSGILIRGDGFAGDSGGGFASVGVTSVAGLLGTVINVSPFFSGLDFQTNKAVKIYDIQITYVTRPVANTYGIRIQSVAGAGNANTQSVIRDVMITGAWIGIDLINCLAFFVTQNQVLYGWFGAINISSPNYPSYCQASVDNNEIWGYGDPNGAINTYAFHIQVQAGGDMRLTNNKCNSGGPLTSGISLAGNSVSTQNMEPMIVALNSVEASANCLYFQQSKSDQTITQVVVAVNQFWGGSRAILVNSGGTGQWINSISFTANINLVNGGSGKTCVELYGIANCSYSANSHSFGSAASGTNTAIVLGSTTTNVNISADNVYDPAYTTEVSDSGTGNVVGSYVMAARVKTQFDKTSDATLANVPGLSVQLQANKTYAFEAFLYTVSGGSGGVKAALGGTATPFALIGVAKYFATSGYASYGRINSFGTAMGGNSAVTDTEIHISGTITTGAGGTLTVQFAQNASNGTASSVLVGSTLKVWKVP